MVQLLSQTTACISFPSFGLAKCIRGIMSIHMRSFVRVTYLTIHSYSGFAIHRKVAFLEKEGSAASSSGRPADQMNLMKQLRERTSVPIEVKAALVDCQWNIDEAQKELRKRRKVVASKKSLRTAAEGWDTRRL
ncbi:hypothetical protein SAY87_023408 [Trapa incisa]|uniref:Uncharacterized protein n=1 Tax=Trapa incisa TaxID=236973 RepID=A0AAN7L6K6_9MYRT|nr:hypothetical protein SAY87_023408 [Trapa incisa]